MQTASTSEHARFIQTTVQERSNTETLRDAQRSLHESEEKAEAIEIELVAQMDTLQRIRNRLLTGNTMLGRMGRSIKRMTRRQAMMRVVWCFVIIVLIAVISLVLYFKLKK